MNWSIVLLLIVLYHNILGNVSISSNSSNKLMTKVNKRNETEEGESKVYHNSKTVERAGNLNKRDTISHESEFLKSSKYGKVQKAFEKLSKDEQLDFLKYNFFALKHSYIDDDDDSTIYSKSPSSFDGKKYKVNNFDKNEINDFTTFINFFLLIGMIAAFMYCLYLILIGCSSKSSPPPSQTLRTTTVTRGPTMIYPGVPPSYDTIARNPSTKQ